MHQTVGGELHHSLRIEKLRHRMACTGSQKEEKIYGKLQSGFVGVLFKYRCPTSHFIFIVIIIIIIIIIIIKAQSLSLSP